MSLIIQAEYQWQLIKLHQYSLQHQLSTNKSAQPITNSANSEQPIRRPANKAFLPHVRGPNDAIGRM